MKLRKGLMANKPRNVLKREEYEILVLKNSRIYGILQKKRSKKMLYFTVRWITENF